MMGQASISFILDMPPHVKVGYWKRKLGRKAMRDSIVHNRDTKMKEKV